jgi:hypothetical protein
MESLPQIQYENTGSRVYFPDRFSMLVKQEPGQSVPLIGIVFMACALSRPPSVGWSSMPRCSECFTVRK